MPDEPITVERTAQPGDKTDPVKLTTGGLYGGVTLTAPEEDALGAYDVLLSPADLLWLVTTGGPAMIALLGGPLAIKGGTAPGEVGQRG